jgi:hypothetical protein
LDSGHISSDPAGYCQSLFEGYFGEKNQKWSRAEHMTTVLLVNDSLADRVPALRDFETLRGYIVKIETLVAELKITLNFKGVIRIFLDFL